MRAIQNIAPILPVRSIPRAIAFYERLGFTARRYNDADDYAFLTRDTLAIHLRRAPDLLDDANPSGIYFSLTPGTAASLEADFRAAGAPILSALALREWRMNEFMLSDPDGNLLRFGEPVT